MVAKSLASGRCEHEAIVDTDPSHRPPAGPRGKIGQLGEDAAERYLEAHGWSVLGRNVRVGRAELDIVALDPQAGAGMVVVEVRSRTAGGYGDPLEAVDARKVARLYRAAATLARSGSLSHTAAGAHIWRIDLVVIVRDGAGDWNVTAHLRGLETP